MSHQDNSVVSVAASAAQIGTSFFSTMIAEQKPEAAYDEYRLFKEFINMHAGIIAAQKEVVPLVLCSIEE